VADLRRDEMTETMNGYPGVGWAVTRAAEWLDSEYPGWSARVRLRSLDMTYPYQEPGRHLLAQLAGYRDHGTETAEFLWSLVPGEFRHAFAPSREQELAAEIDEADQRDRLYQRHGDDSRLWPYVPPPVDGCTRLWRDAVARRRAARLSEALVEGRRQR
jgi:hypothetical protein